MHRGTDRLFTAIRRHLGEGHPGIRQQTGWSLGSPMLRRQRFVQIVAT